MQFRRHLTRPATALLLCISLACGHKRHRTRTAHAPLPAHTPLPAPPRSVPVGTSEEGVASWYGVPYHGRPAADGEIYDMEQLVAAHRTMPFNTWVRVTNLNNGLSVNVRIIDRGPFASERVIDLSKAAARQVKMIGPGTARVRIEVIAAPIDKPADDFYAVQIAALANYSNAERLRAIYANRFGSAQITIKQGSLPLYRILVGKERSPADAQQTAGKLRSELGHEVFVVRLDSPTRPARVAPEISPSAVPMNSHASGQEGFGQQNVHDSVPVVRPDREP